jgi:hypothetical protein
MMRVRLSCCVRRQQGEPSRLQEGEATVALRHMEKEGHVLLEPGGWQGVYTHTFHMMGPDEYARARDFKIQIKKGASKKGAR